MAVVPQSRLFASKARLNRIIELRAGAYEDDEYNEEEDDDEEEEGEEDDDEEGEEDDQDEHDEGEEGAVQEQQSESPIGSVLKLTRRAVGLVGRLTIKTFRTSTRVAFAAFAGEEPSEDNDKSLLTKLSRAICRMWKAAFTVTESESPDANTKEAGKLEVEDASDGSVAKSDSAVRQTDFGKFLSKSYGIRATREELDDAPPVLGGSISDALRVARSQSRLLLILIPSSKPGKGKGAAADRAALESFLSSEVSSMAEKRARRKEAGGSFLLWSAKAGSSEAVVAMKRLKAQPVNKKGQKRPVLLVAYPAQVLDGRGQASFVPISLAQHHCSPPPSPETMAAWMNALRKRHAKQYATMQLEAKEEQYFKDRKEGYKDSIQSDKDRKEREKREEAERIAREAAEKEHQKKLTLRRGQLRASLPDEPSKEEEGSKTISLRLPDGKASQRRFTADTELSVVFSWADVTFEMERETLLLATMNGKKSFSWDDRETTLAEAGLGRLTGLRVSAKKASITKAEAEGSS